MKKRFVDLLTSVGRENTDKLLEALESGGFFNAPAASTPTHHNAFAGGLLQHSLNVCDAALALGEALFNMLDGRGMKDAKKEWAKLRPSVIVATLLHDVGKMGMNGNPYYVPNMLKSGKPSESKPYETNKEFVEDHELLSVYDIDLAGFPLTMQERRAILYHNGLYGNFKFAIPKVDGDILYLLTHFADMIASRCVENAGWMEKISGVAIALAAAGIDDVEF